MRAVMKYFVSLLLTLFFPEILWAVVACGTITSSSTEADPQNISYTPGAGANRVVLFHVATRAADGAGITATATFDGNAMTSYGSRTHDAGTGSELLTQAFWIAVPVDGTVTVSADFVGTILQSTIIAITCTGTNPTNPWRGVATTAESVDENDDCVSIDVPSAVGDLVIDFINAGTLNVSEAPLAGAGQTELYNLANAVDSMDTAGSTEAGAAGNVTMSWCEQTAGGEDWATVGGSLVPTSTGPRPRRPIQFQ